MVDMDFSKLSQSQLSEDSDIKPFKCADADLNEFLLEDAKHFQRELMAVTYLIEHIEQNRTAAFFSLLTRLPLIRKKKTFGTNSTAIFQIQNGAEVIPL